MRSSPEHLEVKPRESHNAAVVHDSASPGLSVEDLECVRDDRVLFSELNFELAPGELLLVEGANGSGKTTLLRAVCGLVRPEQGTVRWQGQDIERVRLEYQAQISYLGHAPGVKDELTPLENLRIARALGVADPTADAGEALARVGLAGYEYTPTRMLSAGQRRRVALARLLLTRASLWILDEPFTALDKAGISMVESLIEAHCENGGMALLTSHHPVCLAGRTKGPLQLTQ